MKRTGIQRRFGEIGSGSLNLRKINKNCQHSNQITFSCNYMSVFSSLILSLPNFIVSVYSSTLPRNQCVTSHSLWNRLDCKVWNGFRSGQKLGKYDKWQESKKTRFQSKSRTQIFIDRSMWYRENSFAQVKTKSNVFEMKEEL